VASDGSESAQPAALVVLWAAFYLTVAKSELTGAQKNRLSRREMVRAPSPPPRLRCYRADHCHFVLQDSKLATENQALKEALKAARYKKCFLR
jgi:hypothetical protein